MQTNEHNKQMNKIVTDCCCKGGREVDKRWWRDWTKNIYAQPKETDNKVGIALGGESIGLGEGGDGEKSRNHCNSLNNSKKIINE